MSLNAIRELLLGGAVTAGGSADGTMWLPESASELAGNWDRVYTERKQVPIAELRTNG